MRSISLVSLFLLITMFFSTASTQEKSLKPGINDSFKSPDVEKYAKTFEGESREVFVNRDQVVKACGLRSGQVVADIGAGTGLYTRLFGKEVGPEGRVFAVDIASKFLEHIQITSRKAGLRNVTPVLCNFDSVDLPTDSVDVAFICDTYHHFEFPEKTMLSLHRAIKPGGRLIVIDFHRIPGKSSDWTLNHVRAGQQVVETEIGSYGFKKSEEVKAILKDNYFVIFTKSAKATTLPMKGVTPASSVIPGYGAAVPLPNATFQPRKGTKVVFDVTAGAKPDGLNKGLEWVARFANVMTLGGLKTTDYKATVVLHGEATQTVLTDAAYTVRYKTKANPNLPLIKLLKEAGIEVAVCGQALAVKEFKTDEVVPDMTIAFAASTLVIERQSEGYAYISSP